MEREYEPGNCEKGEAQCLSHAANANCSAWSATRRSRERRHDAPRTHSSTAARYWAARSAVASTTLPRPATSRDASARRRAERRPKTGTGRRVTNTSPSKHRERKGPHRERKAIKGAMARHVRVWRDVSATHHRRQEDQGTTQGLRASDRAATMRAFWQRDAARRGTRDKTKPDLSKPRPERQSHCQSWSVYQVGVSPGKAIWAKPDCPRR